MADVTIDMFVRCPCNCKPGPVQGNVGVEVGTNTKHVAGHIGGEVF